MDRKKGRVTGVVMLTYRHDVRGINTSLTSTKHLHGDVINTSPLYTHMDEHQCLEIIAVDGGMEEITKLVKGLQGRKDVLSIKMFTAA